jgi:hypothetical protein
MPAWRQGQAVGEWRQLSNSALSAAPRAVSVSGSTGPQSKVIAWTGFAIDTRNSAVFSVANGGHSDYSGNEVNRIGLLDSAPKWTEPRAATPSSQVIENTAYYADGRPTSRHTYYGATFNEARGRAMLLSGARWGDGHTLNTVDGFNTAVNDWDPAGSYPNVPPDFVSPAYSSAVVDDKSTGDVYVFANWTVWRLGSASNSWSKLSSQGVYGQYSAAAMDAKRKRILVIGGDVSDTRSVYDVASNTMQPITFTGPNAGAMNNGGGNGLVYDPGLDAYLLRSRDDAGGTIYRINAQTFYVDTLPTSNGAAIPSTTNGVWKRFLYVPQLKGVVYFPSYEGNAWFIRTS